MWRTTRAVISGENISVGNTLLFVSEETTTGETSLDGFIFLQTQEYGIFSRYPVTVRNGYFTTALPTSVYGTQIRVDGGAAVTIENSVFRGTTNVRAVRNYKPHLSVVNSIFHGHGSGAITGDGTVSSGNFSRFVNCVFAKISAGTGAVIALDGSVADTLVNCIIWGNSSTSIRRNNYQPGLFAYTIMDTTGVDVPSVINHSTNLYTTAPNFGDIDSFLGGDNLIGGGDDGLMLRSGDIGLTQGTNGYTTVPQQDILGNQRITLSIGPYQRPYGQP